MNIKKIEKQLKKISRLIDDIKDEGKASKMEKDLLLSYLRGMYDRVLDGTEDDTYSAPKKVETNKVPKREKAVPSYIPPSPPTSSVAEVVKQEVMEIAAPVAEAPVMDIPVMKSPPVITEPKPETSAAAVVEMAEEAPSQQIPEEIEALFDEFKSEELSDKLGNSPIADLTKCMGINEKIFTVQELFGGDTNLFNTTMSSLNKMSTLSEAKSYLIEHVAIDQNWEEASKIKKAYKFIRLVSRRYN